MRSLVWTLVLVILGGGVFLYMTGIDTGSPNDVSTQPADAPDPATPDPLPEVVENIPNTSVQDLPEEPAADQGEAEAAPPSEVIVEGAEGGGNGSEAAGVAPDASAVASETLSDVLTSETFDVERVLKAVEDSDLSDLQKQVLTLTLEQARENPALVETAISAVKEALNLTP